jgi:hypothetical protein
MRGSAGLTLEMVTCIGIDWDQHHITHNKSEWLHAPSLVHHPPWHGNTTWPLAHGEFWWWPIGQRDWILTWNATMYMCREVKFWPRAKKQIWCILVLAIWWQLRLMLPYTVADCNFRSLGSPLGMYMDADNVYIPRWTYIRVVHCPEAQRQSLDQASWS